MDQNIKTQQGMQGSDSPSENMMVLTTPKNLKEIFEALDKAGVPQDFLSQSERAQEPPRNEILCGTSRSASGLTDLVYQMAFEAHPIATVGPSTQS
jgi:hypothetical protein